jgi:hypothetical protein
MIYFNSFLSWEDVQRAFQMTEPEPDQVIYADYDDEGYEGHANVIYRNNNRLFYVGGGHCSCYGLEGQWDPEEYTEETLLAVFERAEQGEWRYGFWGTKGDLIRERL